MYNGVCDWSKNVFDSFVNKTLPDLLFTTLFILDIPVLKIVLNQQCPKNVKLCLFDFQQTKYKL